MTISIDSSELIANVKEDIALFGRDFKVFAIYSLQKVEGVEFEYISSYVDAEKPARDEADDEEEYQELVTDYEANLASISKTKHELMTLEALLEKLEEQNSVI